VSDDGPPLYDLYDDALAGEPLVVVPKKLPPPDLHVFCACGQSILFGPLATPEMRAHPTCLDCEELASALQRLIDEA
jgi:hypothetical protein